MGKFSILRLFGGLTLSPTLLSLSQQILSRFYPEIKRCLNTNLAKSVCVRPKVIRTATSKEAALKEMPNLFSMLDKAAAKGRAGFCANRAANYKAKAAKVINGLA